ncbi:MAG: hypothetical protein AMXMBFR53_41980 [Gemmatimonadota bacterium]
MTVPASPEELVALWRERAADLRRWAAAEGAACALEVAAGELQAALREAADALVTTREAARISGRSARTLRAMVADGRLRNHGRRGAPRFRRGDLLGAGAKRADGYDAAADARAVLARMGDVR